MKIESILWSGCGDSAIVKVVDGVGVDHEYLLASRPSIPEEAIVSLVEELFRYMDDNKRLREEIEFLESKGGNYVDASGTNDAD